MCINEYLYRIGAIKTDINIYDADKENGVYLLKVYSVYDALSKIVRGPLRKYYTEYIRPKILTNYKYEYRFLINSTDMANNPFFKNLRADRYITYDNSFRSIGYFNDITYRVFNILLTLYVESDILAFYNSVKIPRILLHIEDPDRVNRLKATMNTMMNKIHKYELETVSKDTYLLSIYFTAVFDEIKPKIVSPHFLDKLMYLEQYIDENNIRNGEVIVLHDSLYDLVCKYGLQLEENIELKKRANDLFEKAYEAYESEKERKDDFEQLRLEADFEGVETYLNKFKGGMDK